MHLDRIPRCSTIETGKALSDVWNMFADHGKYDLCVYEPKGFFRAFKDGENAERIARSELWVGYAKTGSYLLVTVSNPGSLACRLPVHDIAYCSGAPMKVEVPAGNSISHRWSLHHSTSWYDFRVTAEAMVGFERRCAAAREDKKKKLAI